MIKIDKTHVFWKSSIQSNYYLVIAGVSLAAVREKVEIDCKADVEDDEDGGDGRHEDATRPNDKPLSPAHTQISPCPVLKRHN